MIVSGLRFAKDAVMIEATQESSKSSWMYTLSGSAVACSRRDLLERVTDGSVAPRVFAVRNRNR